jgi:SSS family solute:Na+ symporter
MTGGVATVCALQITWPVGIPWAFGLTTGAIGLVANLGIFLLAHLLIARTSDEQVRLDKLFAQTGTAPLRSLKLQEA